MTNILNGNLKVDRDFSSDKINSSINGQLTESEVISNGIVLTPSHLSNLVVTKCKSLLNRTDGILAGDYCSGMGAFICALNYHLPNANTLSFEQNNTLFELSSRIYISEKNRILHLDTLFNTDEYVNSFDLLVGNPPYVRVQNISGELKHKLEKSDVYSGFLNGSYDLSVAFIVKALHLLKDGGICGLILPRKIFFSTYGKSVCEYLTNRAQIIEIIDFGDNQLFEDKTTYTCIIIFRKTPIAEEYSFNYYQAPTTKRKTATEILEATQNNGTSYSSSVFDSFPWQFQSNDENMFLNLVNINGCSLTSVFNIVQGFRTGNNKAYLVDEQFPDEPCIRDYIDGTNVKRGYLSTRQHIIWPYRNMDGKVELTQEDVFLKNNPQSYIKLKTALEDANRKDWYGYSRPQNLPVMYSPKIFIKEMMPRAEFAVDHDGSICFSAGYALIPLQATTKEDITAWSFILSTEVMEYQYRCLGTNLHSGWFRMYKKHTENVCLPKIEILRSQELKWIVHMLINDIDNEQLWDRLNSLVAQYFGLSEKTLKMIKQVSEKKHAISIPKSRSNSTIAERPKKQKKKYMDVLADTAYPELSEEERTQYLPVELTCYNKLHEIRPEYRTLVTYQNDKKIPIQRWYKYTQGYSMALVNQLLMEFDATTNDIVFDPFCGGGTTLLVAKNNNIRSVGCDVSPLSCWISKIKTYNWTKKNAEHIAATLESLGQGYEYNYDNLQFKNFLLKAFYPEILAQTVYIQNWINTSNLEQIEKDFLYLALISIQEEISVIRKHGSHYRFLNDESHVGVNKLNIKLIDEGADVIKVFKSKTFDMLDDISMLTFITGTTEAQIYCSDIREFTEKIPKANLVITSPPYLNRNNYFSQQKVELSLLNLIESNKEYTTLVKKSLCSHVEAALPEKPICTISEVNSIIENVLKQKSNNAKIPHMIAGYFNDLDKFFEKLPQFLAPKAKIAFVVANCRWNGVVVPLDHLACRIAEQYGFNTKKIIVARMKGNSPQQMSEFGRIPVRESVVILEHE